MHDKTYFKELTVSNAGNGYRDIIAKVDVTSYRRIPWEVESLPPNTPFSKAERRHIPFFLVHFLDPDTMEPIAPCPRGFLKKALKQVTSKGWKSMAGGSFL